MLFFRFRFNVGTSYRSLITTEFLSKGGVGVNDLIGDIWAPHTTSYRHLPVFDLVPDY